MKRLWLEEREAVWLQVRASMTLAHSMVGVSNRGENVEIPSALITPCGEKERSERKKCECGKIVHIIQVLQIRETCEARVDTLGVALVESV